MKKILCVFALLAVTTTARADIVTTFVLPQIAGPILEKLGQVFDALSVVGAVDNKEWGKYMAERSNLIHTEYNLGRKAGLAAFRACTGENPTNEDSIRCSEQYSEHLQKVKQHRKEELKALSVETRKHRENLIRKRMLQNQINEILE